jgi:hypothetical protein
MLPNDSTCYVLLSDSHSTIQILSWTRSQDSLGFARSRWESLPASTVLRLVRSRYSSPRRALLLSVVDLPSAAFCGAASKQAPSRSLFALSMKSPLTTYLASSGQPHPRLSLQSGALIQTWPLLDDASTLQRSNALPIHSCYPTRNVHFCSALRCRPFC